METLIISARERRKQGLAARQKALARCDPCGFDRRILGKVSDLARDARRIEMLRLRRLAGLDGSNRVVHNALNSRPFIGARAGGRGFGTGLRLQKCTRQRQGGCDA